MSMSSANYLLTEEQLLCCICLEVFTDPVTLPCGHNFCKECIRQHLNFNCERKCPMCKEHVDKKYKLGVNTFISEMAVQFRRTTGRKVSSSLELNEDTQEKVSCHSSTRTKRTKRMSCLLLALGLMCLTLYFAACQTLHQSLSGLRTHLFDTVEKVPDNLCRRHHKPLNLYCKNEQSPICQSCAESSHRFHDVVPLTEQHKVILRELEKAKANIQRSIQEKELKIQDIERSVRLSQEAAIREKTHGAMIFTSLIQSMETAQAELFGMIQEKQKEVETQAKGIIEDLELEILALKRRRTKVEQLSWSKEPLELMQNFPSINSDLPTKDWTEVSVCPELYLGVMLTVLVKSVKQVTETLANEMKNEQQVELEQAQQNAVDVTLDPDTAHPALILSDDGKQVHCGDVYKKVPDTPNRFIHAINVLGKQSFSCGKFHYNVEVKGKTAWTIGVAQHSINRMGKSQLNPENGCWSLCLRNGTMYFALDKQPVPITVNYYPEKIKVFVDYDEGLVSFYDADAAAPLFSFKDCSFTERLHPFFSPGTSDGGRNAAPLIISPVHQYTGN